MTVFFAWFLKNIVDLAVNHNLPQVLRMVGLGISITIVTAIMNYGVSYVRTLTIESISRDLSIDVYQEIMRLPGSSYDMYHSGDLMARLTNDISTIVRIMGFHALNVIRGPLMIISAFVYLVTLNKVIAVLCIAFGPLALIVGFIKGKWLRENGRNIQGYYGRVFGFLSESLAGHVVIRSFGLENIFHDKYKRERNNLLSLEIKEFKIRSLFGIGSQAGGGIVFFACLGLGGYFIVKGSMSVGALMAFVTLVQQLIGPFKGMSNQLSDLQRSLASAERIWQIFDEPKEELCTAGLPSRASDARIDLRFDHVTFRYGSEQNLPVLNDLTLTIPAGKIVALVGPSGAGKSTLLKLAMGFYQPTEGNVYFDVPLAAQLPASAARSYVSYVPQDTYLFSGTIRENLLYGRPEAHEIDIMRATKDANIHDYISSLPDKYDTKIGENGLRLSGGQKQRLAIARALVKNAPVLLLDEATSSLDSETEVAVRDAVHKLLKNRTTLVIAHRLSTILHADTIVVMDAGRIVEQGTHDELLSKNGLYARLYHAQYETTKHPIRKY